MQSKLFNMVRFLTLVLVLLSVQNVRAGMSDSCAEQEIDLEDLIGEDVINPLRCAKSGGGGHEVPTPFDTINKRYDLADGELYLLAGRVVFLDIPGDNTKGISPYFRVALDKFPLLRKTGRLKNLYPLEGAVGDLLPWNQRLGKLLCKAHGRIIQTDSSLRYEIYLEPIL